MRIESYTQIQKMYKSNTVVKEQPTTKSSFSDQLQISSIGKEFQTAKQAVSGAADVREELTKPIKEAMNKGTYEVSNESFADRIFQKYNEMR